MRFVLDELRQQRFDRGVFGDEKHVALQLHHRPSRSAKLREEEVFDVNESDGLIERAIAERIARVPRGADDF